MRDYIELPNRANSSDHEGSVRKTVDDISGQVSTTLDYDAFGNLITAGDYGNPTPTLGVTAYNTGQSETGGQDNHWTVSGNGHNSSAYDAGTGDGTSWADSSAASASWISIRTGGGSDSDVGPNKTLATMDYTYTTTITVAAGSGITSISGYVAADNELRDISVNNVSSGIKFLAAGSGDSGPYHAWHRFVLQGLHVGANTVTFTVRDWGAYTALAVYWGDATVSSAAISGDPTLLPRFLFQGMLWNGDTGLYSMGGGSIYFDPKTNRRTIEDPANEGTNPYAIEANNDNSNRDFNGANIAWGGSLFGYLDPSKLSVTNINVGGNVGTSSGNSSSGGFFSNFALDLGLGAMAAEQQWQSTQPTTFWGNLGDALIPNRSLSRALSAVATGYSVAGNLQAQQGNVGIATALNFSGGVNNLFGGFIDPIDSLAGLSQKSYAVGQRVKDQGGASLLAGTAATSYLFGSLFGGSQLAEWYYDEDFATGNSLGLDRSGHLFGAISAGAFAGAGFAALSAPKISSIGVDQYIATLPRKLTPVNSAADLYEITHTGPFNYQASGGGAAYWMDGYEGSAMLDAKHVGDASRSPFVSGSSIPEGVRQIILEQQLNELRRANAVINDPSNPMQSLTVITNHPGAAQTFQSLLKQTGTVGKVVIKE